MERDTQSLMDLAMWETIYYDPENALLPTDPDEVSCT